MDAFQSYHLLTEDLNQERELMRRSHMLERRPLLSLSADPKVPREELMAKSKEVGISKQKEHRKEEGMELETIQSQTPPQPSSGSDFHS